MKKLLALLLAMTLILSMFAFASCNKKGNDDEDEEVQESTNSDTVKKLAGQTPEELYASVKAKLAEASYFTVDTTQVIEMTYEGDSMTMNQYVISRRHGNNEYIKTTNDMSPANNMEVWYVDGMLYAKTSAGKIKAELDKETFMQQYMGKDPGESTLLDIPESWFKGMKFEKDGEKWILKIVISEEKYEEYFANLGIGGDLVGPLNYYLYFDKDGNLESIKTVCDYAITSTGITITAHMESTATVSFEEYVITPPADADTYQQGYIPY